MVLGLLLLLPPLPLLAVPSPSLLVGFSLLFLLLAVLLVFYLFPLPLLPLLLCADLRLLSLFSGLDVFGVEVLLAFDLQFDLDPPRCLVDKVGLFLRCKKRT